MAIDLNADVGEGFGESSRDDELLAFLTSASVACGFHAGDARIMRETCAAAAAAGLQIGAHVGYQDLEGFGRREIDVEPTRVADDVAYQVGALVACARSEGAHISYVKPHGALYARCYHDRAMADAVAAILQQLDWGLKVLCAPGSSLATAAKDQGAMTVAEGFADRRYAPDGSLVPRSVAGSVLAVGEAVAQAVSLAVERRVATAGGSQLEFDVESICIHSDTPGAVAMARAVRGGLAASGVVVAPFS